MPETVPQRYSYVKVFKRYAASETGEHPYRSVISINLQTNFIDFILYTFSMDIPQ